MKKLILSAALVATVFGSNAQGKLDAASQSLVNAYNNFLANPNANVVIPVDSPIKEFTLSRAGMETSFFVKIADGYSAADLEEAGLQVQSVAGNVAIVNASPDVMAAAAGSDAVVYVQLSQPVKPKLYAARKSVSMDAVHAGEGLGSPYKGAGVVCGIFDSGLDPNHPNFMTTDMSASRVKRVWQFPYQSGGNRAYETPEAIAGFTTDSRESTHGTHTLGCMAGASNFKATSTNRFVYLEPKPNDPTDFTYTLSQGSTLRPVSEKNNVYYGMAPEADLAIACGNLYDSNISSGIELIANYAKSMGQPCVVNLSIGNVVGAHDSHDAFTKYLDNIYDETGALIFISAGNEGDMPMTMVKNLSASDNQLKSVMLSNSSSSVGRFSIYANNSTPFKVYAAIMDVQSGQIYYDGCVSTGVGEKVIAAQRYTSPSYMHSAEFNTAFSDGFMLMNAAVARDNDPNYGRYHVDFSFNLTYSTTGNREKRYQPAVIIEGNAGQRIEVSMNSETAVFSSADMSGWTNGNADFSMNTMACGNNTVMVGAYTTMNKWAAFAGTYYYQDAMPIGEISDFSSYGETYDGRKFPTVCAPGASITSSYNSYYTAGESDNAFSAKYAYNGRTYYWAAEQGTSMSCPIAAGIVATWLQADPTLTMPQVKEIINETSVKDEYVAMAPNRFGAGKINALAGIKKVLGLGGVNDIVADQSKNFIVTPKGDNVYEAFVAGADKVIVAVYNMNGMAVKTVSDSGDTAVADLNDLAKGVYLLNVNNTHTHRLLIK